MRPSAVQVDCYCCLCFYYCPSLIIFLLPHRIFAKWLRHAGNLFLAADRPFRLFVLFLFSLVVFTPELQRPLVRVDCCFCFSHVDDLAYLTVATRWPHGLADLTVASFLHDNCCRTGWLLLFFKILSSETNYFSSASQDIFEFILLRLIAPVTFFGLRSSLFLFSHFVFTPEACLHRMAAAPLSRVDCFFVSLMFFVSHTLIVVLVSCCAFCNG